VEQPSSDQRPTRGPQRPQRTSPAAPKPRRAPRAADFAPVQIEELAPGERPFVVLQAGRERSLRRMHLWVFSGAVGRQFGEAADGDLVEVRDADGIYLASGHFQRGGSIRVRVLSFDHAEDPAEDSFWRNRLTSAIDCRLSLGLLGVEGREICRLVHGEGDRLPGLVVDWYAGVAVIQAHSVGMFREQERVARILGELMAARKLPVKAVYSRAEAGLHLRESDGEREGFLPFSGVEGAGRADAPVSGPVVASENGLKFRVDFEGGQKTGFFVDQRDNRDLVRRLARGRRACNVFAYTGGFTVAALAGGALSVDSVEISAPAVAAIEANVELNFGKAAPHRSFCQDAFDFFELAPQRYDLIVLDPPAFAKHRDALENALKGYRRINRAALRAIEPGGLLFTFSCSQVVTPEDFRTAIFSAAAQAGRAVRVLHQLTQGADHPVNIYHPEGEYLKGLVLQVE